MPEATGKRKGFAGFTAKVLNAAGSAIVDLYDLGHGLIKKGGATFSQDNPIKMPQTTKDFVKKSVDFIYPYKSSIIENQITLTEQKIKEVYEEIGKELVKRQQSDGANSETFNKSIKNLMLDINEYEEQVQTLKQIVTTKLKEQNQEAIKKTKKDKKRFNLRANQEKDALKEAIANSLEYANFDSDSEKSKFEKFVNDLLSKDQELRILATNELANIKNIAAVPVLMAAVKLDDPNLTSEIINALITIGSVDAVPLFKTMVTDKNYIIRLACLRGLYRLAKEDDSQALQILLNAVKDQHPEVRKSAITFIGWKDNIDSIPSLVQSLRDHNANVKEAALSALGTIRDKTTILPVIRALGDNDKNLRQKALDTLKMIVGEEIEFDLNVEGELLKSAVENLIDWWHQKRVGEVEADLYSVGSVYEEETSRR
ncbi:MAG: HEAT repeat domain-containing protein [Desulfamplus sp.]|nr:HEAT repeat domain-containing protein [Desulfamplus sp.]